MTISIKTVFPSNEIDGGTDYAITDDTPSEVQAAIIKIMGDLESGTGGYASFSFPKFDRKTHKFIAIGVVCLSDAVPA